MNPLKTFFTFAACAALFAGAASAAQQTVTIGTPDAGTGDTLPVAFGKVNANFTELYDLPWVTIVPAAGVGTVLAIAPNATGGMVTTNGAATLTNKTLTGPVMTAPVLGTIASGDGTALTGVNAATGDSATGFFSTGTVDNARLDAELQTWAGVPPGTGVATALAVNIGSAGAPVLFNGAGGTPSSLTGTNITGTATGLTAGIAATGDSATSFFSTGTLEDALIASTITRDGEAITGSVAAGTVVASGFDGILAVTDNTMQEIAQKVDDMTAGTGDVTAAANFGTDNRLIRSNGTTKGVQSTGITVDDSDNISGVAGLTATTGNITTFQIGGVTVIPTAAELNYVDGVTSAIQTQLNAKLSTRTGVLRTIYINAGAMIPRTTNGAATGTVETTTNDVMYDCMDFDTATEEGVGFWTTLPTAWNAGTITAKFHWTAASSTGTVKWDIAGRCFTDDDALDQAEGTEQTASADTLLATGDMHVTASTPALTVAGTPAANRPIYFRITRDVAGDTLAADARLLGVTLEYTESATEPSAQ